MKSHQDDPSNVMRLFILLADAYFYRYVQKIGGVRRENDGFGGFMSENIKKMVINMLYIINRGIM
jgi:hypothetical protein